MVQNRRHDEHAWPSSLYGDIEAQSERFQTEWRSGQRPNIEQYLSSVAKRDRAELFCQLLRVELGERSKAGERPTAEEYCSRFSDYEGAIRSAFEETRSSSRPAGDKKTKAEADGKMVIDGVVLSAHTGDQPDSRGQRRDAAAPTENAIDTPGEDGTPERIGRYEVERFLGGGGFGKVYLAYDSELDRHVAIKVLFQAVSHIHEEHIAAHLEHPHFVPVYDTGETEAGARYIVSKYVGISLAEKIKGQRLSYLESIQIVEHVAQALCHAHSKRVYHRDVKPANILLDSEGVAYLGDFGLALAAEQWGRHLPAGRTLDYCSPEQARGKDHLSRAPSDIYSLGVVLFELLTGTRPFIGTGDQLMRTIADVSAPPPNPREIDGGIPEELARICHKAISKPIEDRYGDASEMLGDLRAYLAHPTSDSTHPMEEDAIGEAAQKNVLPKGLRSFDDKDRDFFLDLLPGPRDHHGLPERSIGVWKSRIDELDVDGTFRVGVIHGDSGCGKSSILKAGLLPRLGCHVIRLYVEATADGTEAVLLRQLRKVLPDLRPVEDLEGALRAIRSGQGLRAGEKVLIVLDQFEQWLSAHRGERNTELARALEECSGDRLQCLLVVRSDFYGLLSRFVAELQVKLGPENSAFVDLFDKQHARNVLIRFGQAYGRLPSEARGVTPDQETFVEQAIEGLSAEGDEVVAVRLALFADAIAGKPWTPATYREVGGVDGVLERFLEATFGDQAKDRRYRQYGQAVQVVLESLMPETGSEIKGHRKSRGELCSIVGAADKELDFDDLVSILDKETRLITPIVTERDTAADSATSRPEGEALCYQLTHDYLVPSVREWIYREKRKTCAGRAEITLRERTADWQGNHRKSRYLPSLAEWFRICTFIRRTRWTHPQRRMMRKAAAYHGIKWSGTVAVAVLITIFILLTRNRIVARGHVRTLLQADIAHVDSARQILNDVNDYRSWATPELQGIYDAASTKPEAKLRASLFLAAGDSSDKYVQYLLRRLLADGTSAMRPEELPLVIDRLGLRRSQVAGRLWEVLEVDEAQPGDSPLRAACALAGLDPSSERWDEVSQKVAEHLVSVPATYLGQWMQNLEPVAGKLTKPLSDIFLDAARDTAHRSQAVDVLVVYAEDQPAVLTRLLSDAEGRAYARIFEVLNRQQNRTHARRRLEAALKAEGTTDTTNVSDATLAKRRSNLAVALLRMGRPSTVWPLLKFQPDPTLRSYLIHRFHELGVDVETIVDRLTVETDTTARRALILSLGEFGTDELSPSQHSDYVRLLCDLYRNHQDVGVHSAAEWVLRKWGKAARVNEIGDEIRENEEGLAARGANDHRNWYITTEGHTMAVVRKKDDLPTEFLMGSPEDEPNRGAREIRHLRQIDRSFAIATKEVTVEQFQRFWRMVTQTDFGHVEMRRCPDDHCPIILVTWFEAAAYCNWLSLQEGIAEDQWCYEPEENGRGLRVAPDLLQRTGYRLRVAPDYLHRTGYRLPSEAEWEYACRAGSRTTWSFGSSTELTTEYARYLANCLDENGLERTSLVGSLKPNDLGLFDAHGNAYEWCNNSNAEYPDGSKPVVDIEDKQLQVDPNGGRVLRGGSYLYNDARSLRSALRNTGQPGSRVVSNGFRPARTYP